MTYAYATDPLFFSSAFSIFDCTMGCAMGVAAKESHCISHNCYDVLMLLFQRAGVVFPQRSESGAPVFTPSQTQPLSTYPPTVRNSDFPQEVPCGVFFTITVLVSKS